MKGLFSKGLNSEKVRALEEALLLQRNQENTRVQELQSQLVTEDRAA